MRSFKYVTEPTASADGAEVYITWRLTEDAVLDVVKLTVVPFTVTSDELTKVYENKEVSEFTWTEMFNGSVHWSMDRVVVNESTEHRTDVHCVAFTT